jgi:site-specific recombinase XerD
MLSQGADISTISAIFGHSSIATTERNYAQLTQDKIKERYNKFIVQ